MSQAVSGYRFYRNIGIALAGAPLGSDVVTRNERLSNGRCRLRVGRFGQAPDVDGYVRLVEQAGGRDVGRLVWDDDESGMVWLYLTWVN